MRRRKVLLGLGSLVAGGAAAVGTGAVDSIRADRSMAVDVAGDANAYVGLKPNTDSQFVESSGSGLALDFASDTKNGGTGVNVGTTEARPAFTVRNQGSKEMFVELENPLSNHDVTSTGSGNAASENDITVPAGLDVQFIAVPKGDADHIGGGDAYFLGRSQKPTTGPDFGSATGQQTIRVHPSSTAYRFPEVGYLALEPGEAADVIVRTVASEVVNDVPDVKFTVEAFTDSKYVKNGGQEIDY